jgi:AcrR family transcriptional regulator
MSRISRDRIVQEALSLFAEEGFDRVTLRDLGSRVGLHNSSLFHHFRGKGEIAHGALDRVGEGLLPCLGPLATDDQPRLDVFLGVVGALAERFAARPQEARFLLRVLMDPRALEGAGRPGRRTYPALAVRLFTALADWLRRAQDAGTVRAVHGPRATRMVLGALLLEPALGEGEAAGDEDLQARRDEAVAFVGGALAP